MTVFLSTNLVISATESSVSQVEGVIALKTIQTVRASRNATYTIAITKPQLDALDGDANIFNNALREFIAAEEIRFNRGLPQSPETYPDLVFSSSLDIAFTVQTRTHDYLGVLLMVRTYYGPSPYPVSRIKSMNYSFHSNRLMQLDDVFREDSRYLELLSHYCELELVKTMNVWEKAGTAPIPDNYSNWMLTPDGLRIFFTEGQIGPHAIGTPVVTVPYFVLGSYLAPDPSLPYLPKHN